MFRTIVVLAAFMSAAVVHAQCGGYGYQPQQYGVWQPMMEVVIQPAPGLTIGFYSGPVGPPYGGFQQPYFIPPPPPVIFGGPQFGGVQYGDWGNNYGGRNGGNPAYQQGYDSRWRQRARERQDEQDRAARAAGQRAADRAWGIGPTGGGHRH